MESKNNKFKQENNCCFNMSSPSPVVSISSESNTGTSEELPKKIIVPLDGSEFSFRAAKYAVNIARLTGGEIICVHAVVDLPYIEYIGPGIVTINRYMDEAKKHTEEWFSQVKAMAAKEDIKITSNTIFNLPSVAESIISYAAEQKADLIVIGTRGRSGLKRLVLGSVASGVVAHASCPVLVVR
jgi:nucleotide-binding universal stress UspA family protein